MREIRAKSHECISPGLLSRIRGTSRHLLRLVSGQEYLIMRYSVYVGRSIFAPAAPAVAEAFAAVSGTLRKKLDVFAHGTMAMS